MRASEPGQPLMPSSPDKGAWHQEGLAIIARMDDGTNELSAYSLMGYLRDTNWPAPMHQIMSRIPGEEMFKAFGIILAGDKHDTEWIAHSLRYLLQHYSDADFGVYVEALQMVLPHIHPLEDELQTALIRIIRASSAHELRELKRHHALRGQGRWYDAKRWRARRVSSHD